MKQKRNPLTPNEVIEGKEPSAEEIDVLMRSNPNHSYYSAREELREKAYGGKPPAGFLSWGEYWQSY